MTKYFTRCKECIVHHYWNHMGDQEKSFISVMIGDYVAVPKKFKNNITGQILEIIKLEVADGKTYAIQIVKEDYGLVFRSGWAKFASAYELQQRDMVVFRRTGNSHFRVQIFDPSGCEKEFSCFMMNSNPNGCHHQMSIYSENTICKECAAHHYWNQMRKRCFFLVILDGDSKNELVLPKKYARNVGDQISETIKLNTPDGEIYDIEITRKHNELVLCSGWTAFANAYELEQGDTLVFGYIGDSHFEVQMFSPSNCEKELSCFPINAIPCVQESIISHNRHLQSPGSKRINKACTICKDCISNHYWHHMCDQNRCFIKVMMGASNSKDKLIIPKKFATHVGEQIPEEVQLEVPNGNTYNVKVAKEQNNLVIGYGWRNFASAHDLRLGDFLVFIHSGPSHFKVRIFDPSNCEKEFCSVVMDTTPYDQERRTSHDHHTQPTTSKRSVTHCSVSSTHTRKTSKTSPTDSPSHRSNEDVDIEEPLNPIGIHKSWLFFPMGYNVTSEQKAKIDALEQKIRPQVPLYITAIDLTSVHGGFLVISKDYAVRYLLQKNGTITLSHQIDGSKTWSITLDINTGGSYALSTGWLDFIRDNKLREGDICIFEQSKSKRRVTLTFHPLEEIQSPNSAGHAPSSRSPAHGATEPRYMVPRFTNPNDQEKHEIENKVRAIGSPYHVYVHTIHGSHVTGNYMMLSSKYAKEYLQRGYKTVRLLHPNNSHTWEVEILLTGKRRYRLGKGWRQFFKDNKLKVGDICLFELMESKRNLTMTVHIIRIQRRI